MGDILERTAEFFNGDILPSHRIIGSTGKIKQQFVGAMKNCSKSV